MPDRSAVRVLLVAALSLVVSGCGVSSDPGAEESDVPTSADDSSGDVACSVRFSSSFLNGPELSRDEFAETEVGAEMEAFFVDGPGAPEGGQYQRAEGFSIVSDSVVLGYVGLLPDSFFAIEGGELTGWGSCNLNRVSDDLVAGRWEPAGPVDIRARIISLRVEGGACVTDDGQEILTEVVDVDVEETESEVTVTVWTRDEPFDGLCAGVGVMLDTHVELSAPVGDRSLLDGGTVPPSVVDFEASDGPPPPSTAGEVDSSSLGRLACSPGVVVEERFPDTGQDPVEIAREAAPAVVEVESGQPLWWWGLNENGTVVVGLALGDSDGADYQVWTCDPPLESGPTPDQDAALPEACVEFEELYPGANQLPEGGEVVAEFPFQEGAVVLVHYDQPDASYFGVIECFPGGGGGFTGGGPGETWQGCSRVDYSDAGYAIAIVEDPTWTIAVAGESVDVVQAGAVGTAFIEGTFSEPPRVEILSGDTTGKC